MIQNSTAINTQIPNDLVDSQAQQRFVFTKTKVISKYHVKQSLKTENEGNQNHRPVTNCQTSKKRIIYYSERKLQHIKLSIEKNEEQSRMGQKGMRSYLKNSDVYKAAIYTDSRFRQLGQRYNNPRDLNGVTGDVIFNDTSKLISCDNSFGLCKANTISNYEKNPILNKIDNYLMRKQRAQNRENRNSVSFLSATSLWTDPKFSEQLFAGSRFHNNSTDAPADNQIFSNQRQLELEGNVTLEQTEQTQTLPENQTELSRDSNQQLLQTGYTTSDPLIPKELHYYQEQESIFSSQTTNQTLINQNLEEDE